MTRQLQVIDAHFHMWDLERQHLPWLDGMPSLNRSFPLHELESEYEQLGVEFLGGVYVEVDSDDPLLEDRLVYENNDPKNPCPNAPSPGRALYESAHQRYGHQRAAAY